MLSDMGIYWSFQKPFKERELKKMPYIDTMAYTRIRLQVSFVFQMYS